MQTVIGIIIILHGLVHMWYVVLSQGWVTFQDKMGWTGNSWLLTNIIGDKPTHILATALYSLITILFVISGIGLVAKLEWTRLLIIVSSILSFMSILIFWDGNFNMPVEKGLLGLIISLGLLIVAILFNWPNI